MIRRKTSKANMSLVNMAQEEHLSVSGGIVTSTPVTNLQTVKSSVNFELANDGSYILRKPLVLKEHIPSRNTYYLYNKENTLSYTDGILSISKAVSIKLKFYDKYVEQHIINYVNSTAFITELISVYNALDHTLLSVKIDNKLFIDYTGVSLVHTPIDYNPVLYRFIKIYKDVEVGNDSWIIEIVHPEFNSITSSLDENGIDFNMLLDNPYAIRDLYGYGYTSTTKILAYMPIGSATNTLDKINLLPVYRLTESNLINGSGFKLIVSTNTKSLENGNTVLKAFITEDISTNRSKYYACWERSSNGITWEVCPEFITKFSSTIVEKKVSDLTSSEFEKLIFSDSLVEAASYLVTKQMVLFTDIENEEDLIRERPNEEDLIRERPDVLVVPSLNYQYRFSIYIDTESQQKEYTVTKVASSNYFTPSDLDKFVPLGDSEDVSYAVSENYGHSYANNTREDDTGGSPGFSNGVLVLSPGWDAGTGTQKEGNGITIKFNDTSIGTIKNIKISIGEKQKDTSEGAGTSDYVDVTSVLKYSLIKEAKFGVSGGNITGTDFPNTAYEGSIVELFNKNVVAAEASTELESTLQQTLGHNSWGYGRLVLVPEEHSSEEDQEIAYNGRQLLLNATPVGYKDVAGFSFLVDTPCTLGNLSLLTGETVAATETGWVKHSSVSTTIVTEDIINTTATQELNIDLESYNIYNFTGIKICCFANSRYDENEVYKHNLRIASIKISYDKKVMNENVTSIYLVSTAGPMVPVWSKTTELVADLSKQRQDIFYGEMLFENGAYKFFAKDSVYYSNLDSFIIKALNVLQFSGTVTKILPYRNYLVIFTNKDINLVSNNGDGTYSTKVLSTTVGISKEDAKTAVVILNSIYFKSGTKVYKLVPNLYAYKDDVINIQQISLPIDDLFEHVVNQTFETSNFGYSDNNTYRIFIPAGTSLTYCFVYDLARKAWTLLKYPVALQRIEVDSLSEAYVVKETSDNFLRGGFYHFKDDIEDLLEKIRLQEFNRVQGIDEDGEVITSIKVKYVDDYKETIESPVVYGLSKYSLIDSKVVYSKIPYGDYLQQSPMDLYIEVDAESESFVADNAAIDLRSLDVAPIPFSIDFGQKSSNYMLDKQFLETKMIFATLHPKDMFPVTVDITTDGYPRPLHWDCNTDSPLWKDSFDHIGTLNTVFQDENSDYDGIFRQLIIKYSGKGKTARHLIQGNSKYRFKFISMNTRFRILPNKQ